MPNPFSLIDRLDFDFDLPPLPSALERADLWFSRLSELQRIGVALLVMVFLAASAFYCLGLGSTVLVNRAEAVLVAQQAEIAASLPTAVPTAEVLEPTPLPSILATTIPTPRPSARPTQILEYPTPIPAQLLPTVPLQPGQQRSVSPAEAARPRIVAPYEPPTPTPPARGSTPAARGTVVSGTPGAGASGTPGRVITPTPAFTGPAILRTQTPAASGTRPPGTAAPAAKPTQPVAAPTAAVKPTAAPVFQNPFPSTPVPKPGSTPVVKPSAR